MAQTFMEQFAENGFEPIGLQGQTIYPMFRTPVAAGDRWRVTWLGVGSPRVQGLALRVRLPEVPGARGRAGQLQAAGSSAPSLHLWTDSAPPSVEIVCLEAKEGAELRVSNRWRLENGREDEWLNNFGMLVEEDDAGAVVLRCAEGYGVGPPAFDALVVRLDRLS